MSQPIRILVLWFLIVQIYRGQTFLVRLYFRRSAPPRRVVTLTWSPVFFHRLSCFRSWVSDMFVYLGYSLVTDLVCWKRNRLWRNIWYGDIVHL